MQIWQTISSNIEKVVYNQNVICRFAELIYNNIYRNQELSKYNIIQKII
jgi:hypothetical protein